MKVLDTAVYWIRGIFGFFYEFMQAHIRRLAQQSVDKRRPQQAVTPPAPPPEPDIAAIQAAQSIAESEEQPVMPSATPEEPEPVSEPEPQLDLEPPSEPEQQPDQKEDAVPVPSAKPAEPTSAPTPAPAASTATVTPPPKPARSTPVRVLFTHDHIAPQQGQPGQAPTPAQPQGQTGAAPSSGQVPRQPASPSTSPGATPSQTPAGQPDPDNTDDSDELPGMKQIKRFGKELGRWANKIGGV